MVEGQQNNDMEWVKLVSNDGHSFLIRRKVAVRSGTLRQMLSSESNFAEAVSKTCRILERPIVVEKLCEYLSYKSVYEGVPSRELPGFTERVMPEIALELLMTADYYEA
ncbi:POZ domain-containing protein [Sparassis latifolia]|uniref:Elongin-C n=1 Tax=Sparassis crispa TaxID=139825 RepID=A0A401GQH5_9APHY|nr:Elongin-C [Sparassis crispa]GBE84491.1 Elongin-C [Sparassis crispa]